MWRRDHSRVGVQMRNSSVVDALPAVSGSAETERLAGSKINLVVGIVTETYLVPSPCQTPIFMFGVVGVGRSAAGSGTTCTKRQSLGASSVLLVVVAQVKVCLYGPEGV